MNQQNGTRGMISRVRAFLRHEREGNVLVELALAGPVLMILLTAMFSASMAIYSYEQLGEGVFAGAQTLQDGRGMESNGDPCLTAANAVVSNLPNFSGTFTYTVTIYTGASTSTAYGPFSGTGNAGATCTSGYANMTEAQPAQLTVSYQYQWFPVFGKSLGTGNLTKTVTVMVE
jgi:Flp pilus assembly protein TadG